MANKPKKKLFAVPVFASLMALATACGSADKKQNDEKERQAADSVARAAQVENAHSYYMDSLYYSTAEYKKLNSLADSIVAFKQGKKTHYDKMFEEASQILQKHRDAAVKAVEEQFGCKLSSISGGGNNEMRQYVEGGFRSLNRQGYDFQVLYFKPNQDLTWAEHDTLNVKIGKIFKQADKQAWAEVRQNNKKYAKYYSTMDLDAYGVPKGAQTDIAPVNNDYLWVGQTAYLRIHPDDTANVNGVLRMPDGVWWIQNDDSCKLVNVAPYVWQAVRTLPDGTVIKSAEFEDYEREWKPTAHAFRNGMAIGDDTDGLTQEYVENDAYITVEKNSFGMRIMVQKKQMGVESKEKQDLILTPRERAQLSGMEKRWKRVNQPKLDSLYKRADSVANKLCLERFGHTK